MFNKVGERTFKAIILSGCKILVSVVGLVILMLLSRCLTSEDYANFRQFLFISGLASPLILLGAPQAITFFLPNNAKKSKQFILISFSVQAFLLILLFTICFITKDIIFAYYSNYNLTDFIVSIWAWVFLSSLLQVLASVLIAMEKPMLSGSIMAINAFMTLVGILLFLDGGITNIYSVYPISASLTVISILIYLFFRLNDCMNYKSYFADTFDYLKFAVPIFFSQYVGSFGRKISSLMVVPFLSTGSFAIFANGAFEIPFISIVGSSAIAVITPEFIKLFKEKNINKALQLWSRASLKTCVVIFPIFTFLFTESENILIFLFSEKYIESVTTFRCFLLLMPLQAMYFGLIYIASNNPKILLIRSIVTTVLSIIFTYLICVSWEPMCAPLGIVFAAYGWALPYNLHFFKKIMGVSFFEYIPIKKIIYVAFNSLLAIFPLVLLGFFKLMPLYEFIIDVFLYPLFYLCLIKISKNGYYKNFQKS